MIKQIGDHGFSQSQIGAEIGLSQVGVSDVFRGRTKTVTYDVGTKLVAMHARVCGTPLPTKI